ncbi:lysosome-associated membrane glycoprotein 2 isoform X1 [Diorhabda sublineata]|uniref:lysosome-associated membrane glycoprotein 2 isoform X1 n=1 Tax=Diorhabda sublineata TaxID=1163346 RepID=UPI0024E05F7C|nr:lysosome-associated membrane glycoprotein 2 isoform X1 [Diorhabda sublineata]
MEYSKILIVFSFFVCLSVSEKVVPPEPNTRGTAIVPTNSTFSPITTSNPNNTTTISPKTTTISPNTTTISPNTTTISPNTTTISPNTTTISPNTTSIAPNTTTPNPTTTPSPTTTVPTSTPSPTPLPNPSTGNWSLNYDKSNYTCLVIDAAFQIELLVVNSTSKKINIPVNATSDGSCGNNTDILNLRWDGNVITMNFTKNATEKKFDLEFIRVSLNGTKNNTLIHEKPEFKTLLDHSYKCAKLQTLNFTKEHENDTVAYLHISHAQFQAFSNVTGHHFYDAIDCEASNITSDVVPIVVGCVLAILVVVVLVAYLYGRRRCQARGYLSMFSDTRSDSDYIPMKNLSCFK